MSKVLIIKLGALGDMFRATPAIRSLCQHYGEGNVSILTIADLQELVRELFGKTITVIVSPRHKGIAALKTALLLKQRRFDIVVDLRGNTLSKLYSWASCSTARVGLWPGWPYNKSGTIPRNQRCDVIQIIRQMFKSIDIEDPYQSFDERDWMNTTPRNIEVFKERNRLRSGQFILMHAGSSSRWISKRWPESHFLRLAKLFSEQGITTVWIGGDDDKNLCARLAYQCGVNACGKLSITDLVHIGKIALLSVTNDSAPMHALGLSGGKVFGIFGPTDWQRSYAINNKSQVLRGDAACSPCHRPVCPLDENKNLCMTTLTPELVMKRIHQELKEVVH